MFDRLENGKARNGEDSVSRATFNREVQLLRAMFGKAVLWGMLAQNPANRVQDYAEDETRERFLTRAVIRRLMLARKRSFSPLLRPVVALALETGMRKGELFRLRWSDVDFDANQLLVSKSKTGKQRHVPLSRRARWVLRKMAARAPLSEWVFQSRDRDGAAHAVTDVKRAWRQALVRARIRDFRFHDLRHTFASHFAMKGGSLFALANILGHSNPHMTLKRYTHLDREYIAEQRRVMDAPIYAPAARGIRENCEAS